MYELTFWLRWVCVALRGFLPPLRGEWSATALAAVHRFSQLRCLLWLRSWTSLQASVAVALGSKSIGLAVMAHGLRCSEAQESSQTRGWNPVHTRGRWILNHCT